MAKIQDLFDAGRGKLGNLVVYKMNGQSIIRTKPEHYSDRKSPAQLAQRQRMKVVNEFLSPFLELIRLTFPPQKVGRTARSEAQSYIMRNTLAGEYPNIYVDKSRALLSRGPLPVPVHASVTSGPDGLLIEWENGAEAAGSRTGDTLVVMVLQAETGQATYRFTDTRRSEGRYMWTPALPQGTTDVWLAFRNREQTEMSNSMYVKGKGV